MKKRIEREPFFPAHYVFMHIKEDTKTEPDILLHCWAPRQIFLALLYNISLLGR